MPQLLGHTTVDDVGVIAIAMAVQEQQPPRSPTNALPASGQ